MVQVAVNGYYDGAVFQPLERTVAKKNQRVIITLLDDFVDDVKEEKTLMRIGAAKGKFIVPDDIDFCNDEIATLFYGDENELSS